MSKTAREPYADPYAGTSRAWKYDADAARIARAMRNGHRANEESPHKHFRKQAENSREAVATEAHRQTDRFERAKAWLQRSVPVYAATIIGGDKGKFVIGHKIVARDDVIAMARAKGFQG